VNLPHYRRPNSFEHSDSSSQDSTATIEGDPFR